MMLTINKATKIIGNGPHEKKTLLQKVDLYPVHCHLLVVRS